MPSMDFGDVAARIAVGLSGVRACLVVSRDGLSLGAYPADAEGRGREVWDLLEQLGDVTRGFVEMGMEMWVLSRRGPYGAVVVASPDVKPGLILDRIEANLVAAEQLRTKQTSDEPMPLPRPEPVRRPRSPLHPEPRLEPEQPDPQLEPGRPAPPLEPVQAPREAAGAGGVVDLSKVPDPEPDTTEAVAETGAETVAEAVPETVAEAETLAEPVVEPPPPPAPEPTPAPAPEPPPAPAAPPAPKARPASPPKQARAPKQAPAPKQPPAPKPAPVPAAEAEAPAKGRARIKGRKESVEHVPTFRPASTPEPAADEVYVAGVSPATGPPPEAIAAEPPPEAKKPARRRFRRKSGEVDRVALAREFGQLMKDEFGV